MGTEQYLSTWDSSDDQSDGEGGPSPSGIRVGVLGVGYWGSKQLRVMGSTPGVERVVAIDARLPLLSGMAHLVADGGGYTSLAEALPRVDAVVIATPPASHVPLGLEAIRAGKHVLIEKPMATTAAGAEQLIEAESQLSLALDEALGKRITGIEEELREVDKALKLDASERSKRLTVVNKRLAEVNSGRERAEQLLANIRSVRDR